MPRVKFSVSQLMFKASTKYLRSYRSLSQPKAIFAAALPRTMIRNLDSLLETCTRVCADVILVMRGFVSTGGVVKKGVWKGLQWELFKKRDVEVLRETLGSCKLTISLACSSLTM
jgi:hypothetical protein